MDIHIQFNNPVGFLTGSAIVLLTFLVGRFLGKLWGRSKTSNTAESKMENTVGVFFFLFLTGVAALTTFVMLFIGHAAIPALVGVFCFGMVFGLGSRT